MNWVYYSIGFGCGFLAGLWVKPKKRRNSATNRTSEFSSLTDD